MGDSAGGRDVFEGRVATEAEGRSVTEAVL